MKVSASLSLSSARCAARVGEVVVLVEEGLQTLDEFAYFHFMIPLVVARSREGGRSPLRSRRA